MAFDPERLRAWQFEPIRHSYSQRDVILYALGVGLPCDPSNRSELDFLLEDRLKVLPTFAVTLASAGMWVRAPELEIDWVRLLHTAQAATFHRLLPPAGSVVGQARIRSLHDRGREKGAVCVVERTISDAVNGELYCTLEQTLLLRGNGGFGGEAPSKAEPTFRATVDPAMTVTIKVSKRAALIYRLSGDLNPLHADPGVASEAGFKRPILHGLASYGIASALVLQNFCNSNPAFLASLSLRFVGVVLPGDTLAFSFWKSGSTVLFEAKAGERAVLDQGVAEISKARDSSR
jgi:acyl dehydratase